MLLLLLNRKVFRTFASQYQCEYVYFLIYSVPCENKRCTWRFIEVEDRWRWLTMYGEWWTCNVTEGMITAHTVREKVVKVNWALHGTTSGDIITANVSRCTVSYRDKLVVLDRFMVEATARWSHCIPCIISSRVHTQEMGNKIQTWSTLGKKQSLLYQGRLILPAKNHLPWSIRGWDISLNSFCFEMNHYKLF